MKRRNLLYISLTIIMATFLVSCSNADAGGKTMYKKITAEEAKKMMDTEEVIILDVRTLEEYVEGHIKNAILLPNTDISLKADKVLPDKNAKILVYCRSGRRSEKASKELIKMGYTNVYDFGGIIDWKY